MISPEGVLADRPKGAPGPTTEGPDDRDMVIGWTEGWAGLLEATAGFHDGVVQSMDLTSQSFVRADLSMVRPNSPADVRLLVQLQNADCPAVLIDFVDVLECSWSNQRNIEWREPQAVGDGYDRYEILEFTGVAAGIHWMRLDDRALGGHAGRIRRAGG